ncbi:MAG TPA: DUF192 domain-containing protein [Planctomycetota bacterium]|nr:DUF192 domain-containing protein [Planctomycetota bacterium]
MTTHRIDFPRDVMRRRMLAALFGLVAASAGCGKPPPSPPGAWDRVGLDVGGKKLVVEVASDGPSRRLGLMNRPSLPENEGMLFIFPHTAQQSFWMKNTLIPLSIAFIDDSGKILEIHDMKAKDETSTWSKNGVRYALEVNQGWFDRNQVKVGDVFADFRNRIAPFRGS